MMVLTAKEWRLLGLLRDTVATGPGGVSAGQVGAEARPEARDPGSFARPALWRLARHGLVETASGAGERPVRFRLTPAGLRTAFDELVFARASPVRWEPTDNLTLAGPAGRVALGSDGRWAAYPAATPDSGPAVGSFATPDAALRCLESRYGDRP